jgi:hypothetical protein
VLLVAFLLTLAAVAITLGFAPMRLVSTTWRSLIASVIMFTAIMQIAAAANWNDPVTLVSSIGLGIVLFPALIFLLWTASGWPDGPESQITQWLAKRFKPERNAIN